MKEERKKKNTAREEDTNLPPNLMKEFVTAKDIADEILEPGGPRFGMFTGKGVHDARRASIADGYFRWVDEERGIWEFVRPGQETSNNRTPNPCDIPNNYWRRK